MNYIELKGTIRNIQYSHTINDTEYDKADLIVKRDNGEDDVILLCFKKFACPYKDGQEIELCGHLRSYSHKAEDGSNKVEIYVFTYFDLPDSENETDETNIVELDGRVCKVDKLRVTKRGKHNMHFILANNIINVEKSQKINNYIPCVAWGNLAKELANIQVSDMVEMKGQLHSRTYKKYLPNGGMEIKTAHEIVILDYNKVDELEV